MGKKINVFRGGRLEEMLKAEQGKHFCNCGCGQPIVITKNHLIFNGIPEYILGHAGRKRPSRYGYLNKKDRMHWANVEQGRHFCNCGCKQPIIITVHHYSNGIPKYIHGHQVRDRKYPDTELRFWPKVNKGNKNDCWLWIAFTDKEGYGHIRTTIPCVRGLAHRFSYFLHYGEFDPKCHVLHNCPKGDNPGCVNPDHLFLGTHADNMKDAAKKGSFAKKLDRDKVLRILTMNEQGVVGADIARKFGIDSSSLCVLLQGKTWKHVFEEFQNGERA